MGAFTGAVADGTGVIVACLGVIAGLALIGGLALACFTKAFGIVFLGEPRSDAARDAHEANRPMRAAMLVLAAGCLVVGLTGPFIVGHMGPVLAGLTGLDGAALTAELGGAVGPLTGVVTAAGVFIGLVVVFALVRRRLLAGREVASTVTWDCGYAQPTARMQYTASSFAQPLTDTFRLFLHTRQHAELPRELFPTEASMHTETPDTFRRKLYQPAFGVVRRLLERTRKLQHGHVQLYVLYIAAALLALLLWKLR